MILLQHVALYVMAAMAKADYESRLYEPKLLSGMSWLLLPDALEAWGCPKALSHFWETPDGTNSAWMEFPIGGVLCELDKETLLDSMSFHFDEKKYGDCVLGNTIDLGAFDEHNYDHANFSDLRIHLIHDAIQEKILCDEVVNVNGRFDDRYVMRNNPKRVLNGHQLREEIRRFEEQGFLYLVGKVYRKTHVLLDQKWFDERLYGYLVGSYSDELFKAIREQFRIPAVIESAISRKSFELDYDEVCKRGILGIDDEDELKNVYNRIYSWAYVQTAQNM